MNNMIVSIIIPVFNVEKYLKKCVDSVTQQTYQNLEIILVDDGSTDGSGKLCDVLAAQDSRIKVIHQDNSGLSSARNTGIRIATGNYIQFIDSDDWMEADTIEISLEYAIKNNSDVVIYGYSADFVSSDENVEVTNICIPKPNIVLKKEWQKLVESDSSLGISGYAWNKLYKRSILEKHQIFFEKGIALVEDILFNEIVFSYSNRIQYIENPFIHYIQRHRETLGTKYYPDFFELKISASQAREHIFQSFNMPDKIIPKYVNDIYCQAVLSTARMICRSSTLNNIEKKKHLHDLALKEQAIEIMRKFRPIEMKNRLIFSLLKWHQYSLIRFLYRL